MNYLAFAAREFPQVQMFQRLNMNSTVEEKIELKYIFTKLSFIRVLKI